MRARILLTSAALAVVAMADVAHAQDAADETVAESDDAIVVTAQRRSQSKQDVGIALAAYGGDELRSMNVSSSTDVARLTPGVHISGNVGGQMSQFTIRGVTQNDFNDAIEAPVAVYVDDSYIPNMQGQTFGLFDLERVEVLKGPQGTLFGRNARAVWSTMSSASRPMNSVRGSTAPMAASIPSSWKARSTCRWAKRSRCACPACMTATIPTGRTSIRRALPAAYRSTWAA